MDDEEVLTGSLFPVISIPDETDDEEEEYDIEYRRSMKWDYELGDFVRDGANQVKEADGYEAYALWCYKVAQTERGNCLAYPDEIGAELEYALSFDDTDVIETLVERTITEAIEVNPRTEYVRNFEFTWDGDTMHITFTVKGINWDDEIEIAF